MTAITASTSHKEPRRFLAFWGRYGTSTSTFRKPKNWAYRTYVWSMPLWIVLLLLVKASPPSALYPVVILTLFAWLVWAMVGLWAISRADIYDAVPFGMRIALFCWASCAVYADLLPNTFIPPISRFLRGTVVGPMIEEAIKLSGVVLVAAITPYIVKRPLGAIICGMISGLGFAFIENSDQFTKDMVNSYSLFLLNGRADWYHPYADIAHQIWQRGLYNTFWLHSLFAAITSLGVYWFVANRSKQGFSLRLLVLCLSYVLAVSIHGLNNALVFSQFDYDWIQPLLTVYQALTLIVLLGLVAWGIGRERRWYDEVKKSLDGLATVDQTAALRTRTGRLKARVRVFAKDGMAAFKALAVQQRLQLAYLNAKSEISPSDNNEETDALRNQILQ
eukprot:gene12674-15489_t